MLRRALASSGHAVLPEVTTGPPKETMRGIATRIAEGDERAYDELAAVAREMYHGIDYRREAERVRLNLFKMKAAFDVLGEEAGKGNDKAMGALKRCLREHNSHLASFAPDALGIAAAAGRGEALDILIQHDEWGILESSAIFALSAPASANRERAVDYLASWLSNPDHSGGGMALSAAEALEKAALKGNDHAKLALVEYEKANPKSR